jgi:hypothetical protein
MTFCISFQILKHLKPPGTKQLKDVSMFYSLLSLMHEGQADNTEWTYTPTAQNKVTEKSSGFGRFRQQRYNNKIHFSYCGRQCAKWQLSVTTATNWFDSSSARFSNTSQTNRVQTTRIHDGRTASVFVHEVLQITKYHRQKSRYDLLEICENRDPTHSFIRFGHSGLPAQQSLAVGRQSFRGRTITVNNDDNKLHI